MSVAAQRYSTRQSFLINAFWVPLFFQDAALPAISVPAVLTIIAPQDHVKWVAFVLALVAFVSMVVPPIAGAVSDRLRARGVPRRIPILAGAALDVACLLLMAQVHTVALFVTFYLLATLGANVCLAAYQALIPDVVPQASWGMVSGIRSVAMVVGTALGLGMAMGTYPSSTFIGLAAGTALAALTLFAVVERTEPHEEEHAHVSDWNDFTVVFVARAFLAFGLALLMTFIYVFFHDVLHVANASVGTGTVAVASLAGAIASGIFLGWLSDRVSRKIIVASCGVPMTLAAAGFALFPEQHWMFGFAALFGIGFGGIMSTGWALAMDAVPQLRDVARDLGIWGIAQNFPQVIAPIAGWSILGAYHNSIAGYQVLFFAAAASFLLGSLVVLAVGKRALLPWWSMPVRLLAAAFVYTYIRIAYRVRAWGWLPSKRGATLVISNHQVEQDLMAPISRLALLRGGWRTPVLTASARLMYEPGFMAVRVPWLWRFVKGINFGWLFAGLGFLPLENELQTRSIARWSWDAQRRHGVLPLEDLFKPAVLDRTGLRGLKTDDLFSSAHFKKAQQTPVRLSDLNLTYRKEAFEEMKRGVEADLQRIEDALKCGATFYITPEGEYTKTGAMLPFRGIWERMLPHAQLVYAVGISYDPFIDRRLNQLFHIVEVRDRQTALAELKACRPVTISALLAEWLVSRGSAFTEVEAVAAIEARLASLPHALFVDPDLVRAPQAMVVRALSRMTQLGILHCSEKQYTLSDRRVHPNFPGVDDIVAFQARFFGETLEGLQARASA
jgi:MFS family permease